MERDAWIEALLGGRLRFQAKPGLADSNERVGYWMAVYKRWAQLYGSDCWRKRHDV